MKSLSTQLPDSEGMMRRFLGCLLTSLFGLPLLVLSAPASPSSSPPSAIDFSKDVKPILSDHCYACHGPDENKRKGNLRLDLKDDAFKPAKSGLHAITPGVVGKSELYKRITTQDPDDRMPPDKGAKPLTTNQVQILKRWIEEGAKWQGHWAYQQPVRVAPPTPNSTNQVRNAIDSFLQTRLEKEGMGLSNEADRHRLIRRVTLDLTGLPPTPEEIRDFVGDKRSDAYEQLIDRLLASKHFGERMVLFWLDLARFADTQGYHHDDHRDMHHWRDWAVKAFNDNMPFDQFTIEQLAGDLLPNPTREQKIATAFHRNEMTTSEGGAMPEEYSVKYVSGRVDTTSRVWLGTSMACAECHDHKYDPISQKEFYQMFAYFNTIPENGLDASRNPVPRITLSTSEHENRLAQLDKEITNLETLDRGLLDESHPARDREKDAWLTKIHSKNVAGWELLTPSKVQSANGTLLEIQRDGSVAASGNTPPKETYEVHLTTTATNITGIRLEALPGESSSGKKSGRSPKGDFVLTSIAGTVMPNQPNLPPRSTNQTSWYLAGSFAASSSKEAFDKKYGPEDGVDLGKSFNDGKIKWIEQGSMTNGWTPQLTGSNAASFFYRKSFHESSGVAQLEVGRHDGLRVFLNGRQIHSTEAGTNVSSWPQKIPLVVRSGENSLLIKVVHPGQEGFSLAISKDPVREYPLAFASAAADFNGGGYHIGGALDDRNTTGWSLGTEDTHTKRSHSAFFKTHEPVAFGGVNTLKLKLGFESPTPMQSLANFRIYVTKSDGLTEFFDLPDSIRAMMLVEPTERTGDQQLELQRHYRKTFVPEIKEWVKTLGEKRRQRDDYKASIPVSMVMEEMQKPRDTHILIRGEFHNRGEKVRPGVPKHIMPMPSGYPENRLGLAKWLVHPEHPLTARVTVNHYWHQYFGTGIVKTPEEFGSQGDWPSHPELLDWLATEFIRSGWNVKAMQRLIVTSAAYRQSAVVSSDHLKKDPENRLLARFPRIRLEAETLRDTALAASGLLNLKMGGPSVYPYQPPGMWEAVAFEGTRSWNQSSGEDNYRRGIYTYWRRSIPYPSFVTFDAPTRETCTVKRPRTNTPLQALVLMNDPVYVEASRALGHRIMTKGGKTLKEKIEFGFLVTLGRPPTARERRLLESAYQRELKNYTNDRVAAARLVNVGASKPPIDADICELAAWTIIGNTLLNLDEVVNKG